MLNKRCLEIIEYLIENNNTFDLKVMANKFGISERSIRYDMDNINYFFKKNNLNQLKKESKGTYHLNETTENLLEVIEILNIQFYTFSKAERINYIKSVCYFFTDVIRLHEISETLSVSISTVKLDLKDVKNHLCDNNLELVPLSKQGLILEGDEEKIRKMQLKFLLNYVKFSKGKLKSKNHSKETFGSKIVINEILLYFEDISIGDIEIFIKRIEKQLKIIISDEAYKVLKFYMMLSIIRLSNGKEIEKREENENFLKQTKEYNVLLKELPHLEENFKIKFNDSELLLLTELFLGSHSYNFNTSFFKNWIEIEMSIHKMIKEVGSAIGVDLIGDKILLEKHLSQEVIDYMNEFIGFPNSAVDRIVPPMAKSSDILRVRVEEFKEWIVEAPLFKGEAPKIEGMDLTDNLMAFIERKLFTLNTGHAITAYLGVIAGHKTVKESIEDNNIEKVVKSAMHESGEVLINRYGFERETHNKYIEKILNRFKNPYLVDEVDRVGRQPLRKLGYNDRLIKPLRGTMEYGTENSSLIKGIGAALKYRNSEDEQAVELEKKLNSQDLSSAIKEITSLEDEIMITKIKKAFTE